MAPVIDNQSIKANWRCFVACGIVLVTPFQYGVDFGIIGGLQAMVGFLKIYGQPSAKAASGWNLTPVVQQLISSLMTLGAFLSSGTAGFVASKFGRRPCLWAACLLCVVSNIIMMATENVGALYAGRFLNGLANGFFMTFSQLYIQESSPAKWRGLFLAMFQFCTSFGTLIGTIVDWATAKRPDKTSYLIPLGIIYVVPVFLTIGLFFIPESPRWLINHGKYEEGVKSLAWLRPDDTNVRLEAEEIRDAIEREREIGGAVAFLDMFRNPVDRRRTFLSIAAVTLQAASGSMFIIAYKAYFFTMAKVANPFAMTCVLSAVGLVALIINACIITKFGRRRVLISNGLVICGVLQLAVALTYQFKPGQKSTGTVLVALSCLYMMSYNGLIASYAWLAGGEIPSQRLRSYTFGFAAAVGFFGAWLTTFTAPYFINPDSLNWGPKYGYIWAPSCAIAAVWVLFFLPETKGRKLEEIDEMFEARLPARKFRHYVCTNSLVSEEKKSGPSSLSGDNEKSGAYNIEDTRVEDGKKD